MQRLDGVMDKFPERNQSSPNDSDSNLMSEESDKVSQILSQVSQLSELEKYMLYLQLPTEEAIDDNGEETNKIPSNSVAKRTDTALRWIRQHYAESHDTDSYVPKEEVYEQYKEQCEADHYKVLSSADFGKAMKIVFPKITHRRLGQRGKSKYCYEGLKKKGDHSTSPCTSSVQHTAEKPCPDSNLYALSCQLVCEWASQLLSRQLTDIKSLSEYLISIGFSCGKTAAKFSLLSGSTSPPKQSDKDRKAVRHQDGQVLIQRKLQHKEIIRKHKQKLQEQQKVQRELAKACSPVSSVQPFTVDLGSSDVVGRKRILPRPQSVQPCVPYWNTGQVTGNVQTSESVLSLAEMQKNVSQDSSKLLGILLANSKNKGSLVPLKRCQSASVVEKHSMSCDIGEVFRQQLTSNQPFCDPKKGSDTIQQSSLQLTYTTISLPSPSISTMAWSNQTCSKALDSLLSTSGLMLTQQHKRNGGNISPDWSSKRRCMTSLGVREPENFHSICAGDFGELNRARPYSCPVSWDGLPSQSHPKSRVICGASDVQVRDVSSAGPGERTEKSKQKPVCSDSFKEDGTLKSNNSKESQENKFHFVQKPTVINRPMNLMHNVSSCPDFQQISRSYERQESESRTGRMSGTILNSLLSSTSDLLWKKCEGSQHVIGSVETHSSLSLAASIMSTAHSSSEFDSKQNNHQFRLMNPPPSNSSENNNILSALSSRSAFVPVTSHKQLVSSAVLKEAYRELSEHNHSLPLSESGQTKPEHCAVINTSTSTTQGNPKVESSLSFSSSVDASHFNKQSIDSCGSVVDSSTKADVYHSASVSDQVTAPVSWSGCTASSGNESAFTSPITSLVSSSSVEVKSGQGYTSKKQNLSTSSPNIHVSGTTTSLKSGSPGQSQMTSISPSPHTSQTNSSPVTPPRRVCRNRFTPIRPKIGGAPSPQKLVTSSTTPSPQKKDLRKVSTILKEQRLKIAQDLLVNLANSYQGEVKLQMPAELLGLSPGKSKSADVLVTIGPPNNKNLQTGNTASPQLWPILNPSPHHQDVKVVVDPVTQAISNTSPVFSSTLLSPPPGSTQRQSTGQSLGLQVITCHKGGNNLGQPLALYSPTMSVRHEEPLLASSKQVVIISPPRSASSTEVVLGKSGFVEDYQGNKYSIEDGMNKATLNQNLGLQCQNKPTSNDSVTTSELRRPSSGVLNVSEINGHMIGPDANGQTYLLVPNSEPSVSVSNGGSSRSLAAPSTTMKPGSAMNFSPQQVTSCSNGPRLIQTTTSSSSALLSELSQLASASQKMANQPLIQHNSFSSAFHKCSSKLHLKSPTLLESPAKFDAHGNKTVENVCVSTEVKPQKTAVGVVGPGMERSPKLTRDALETPGATKNHPVRKRKSGADEHGSNKKSNRSKEKEADDDVFIINIDDEDPQQNSKVSVFTARPESADSTIPSWYCEKKDVYLAPDQESKPQRKPLLTDTETLLEMIPNTKAKSMTVKETVMALNCLRAKISGRDRGLDKCGPLEPLSQQKPGQQNGESPHQVMGNKATAISNSAGPGSPAQASYSVNSQSSTVQLCKRTGGRYVSLNLESLESDALLDIEQALDRKLFGDLPVGYPGFSDRKTSVGIAAKSTKALAPSNQTKQPLLSQQISENEFMAESEKYLHHNAAFGGKKQNKVYKDVSQSGDALKENIDKQNSFLFEEVKEPATSNVTNHCKNVSENNSDFFSDPVSRLGTRQEEALLSGFDRKNSNRDFNFQADFLDFLQSNGSASLSQDSSDSSSSTDKGKASDHPTLAQWLTRTVADKPDSGQRYSSPALPSYYDNLPPAQTASQANMSSENELPGDIVDFITESMSSRKHYNNSMMFHNSPSSLLADLIKKDKQDNKEIQNSTIWRSISVPNTPAACDMKQPAVVGDVSVKPDAGSDNRRNSQCGPEHTASHSGSIRSAVQQHTDLTQQKSIEISTQNSSSGTFLSPVGPAKLTRRLSVERSVSSEYSTSKTPNAEPQNVKANDRPPSRLKTNAERLQSKTPVDRLISKILTDRSGRHEGMSDPYQQMSREKESTRSLLSRRQPDKSRHGGDQGVLANPTCTNWMEAGRGDRSLNQTPLSDGGYSSVSQTPISEVGSVSPSPTMMAAPGFFGDCERQDILSPATIFMPLRSDSVLSGLYHTRSCGPDSFTCKQSNSSQVSGRGSEEQEHTVLNVRSQKSQGGSKLLDVLTGFEMDPSRDTTQSDSVKSYDQNLNASFLQLHCIPTPPSSPSSPNQRAQETVHSPLHFKEAFSESTWQNESLLTASAVSFGQEFSMSSAGHVQPGTSRQTVASSPKNQPITSSPTPQVSRCHQYNPHPSPPFTPSSQRCVLSPRCPTPCSHISPRCNTPNSDSNLAPNRFVPIQTSGILGNSAVGYIQPIRPVVTIASAANQNLYSLPLFSSPYANKKSDPFITYSFIKSENDVSSSSGVQLQLKTDQHTQVTSERSVPPAFVLSLTGAIGSVSGKGMKDGWGSQDITVATMSHQTQSHDSTKVVDQTQSSSVQFTSDMLPTYEEAVSLLSGSNTDYKNQNLAQPENRERHQAKTTEMNPIKSVDKSISSVKEASQQSAAQNHVSQAKSMNVSDSPSQQHKISSSTDAVTNSSDKQTEHSLTQHSTATGSQSLARQLQNSNSLRLLLGSSISGSRKKSSLSTMLQAPAFTSVSQKPQTSQIPAEIPTATLNLKNSPGTPSIQAQLVTRIEWKSSGDSDYWLGNSSTTAPATDAGTQEAIRISELPTAYYTGTAPNKTAFSIPSFDQWPMYYGQQAQLINIRSDKRDAGSRQDELDETLDVLKNLDSHYFQQEDDDDML